jgi:hypothetical protein
MRIEGGAMQSPTHAVTPERSLPFILIVAVIQGWALYALHHAVVGRLWPATQPAWLFACYGVAIFVPITLQLLARFARDTALWAIAAVVAIAYFYFGWHYGGTVLLADADNPLGREGGILALGAEAVVLWLLLLPFLQARLLATRWNAHYPTLFSRAWHNVLVLAEAGLFTGLFWLLLILWAGLFHMLGIDFFRELFREPVFIYPVSALTFGIALHLIGSIERLTSVVLEQVLNVLKWLAIVAGLILTLFTIALVTRLPELVTSGQRAIGAAWLLWLVAVIVLLLNAAYRDGTVARPYPTLLATALRWIVPLTIVIAGTAIYALSVRTNHYGLTVERVWAFVVAGAALIYAVGYSIAAFERGGWLARMSQVNVVASLALIVVIACALTPILSPYRLSANSQYHRALLPASEPTDDDTRSVRRSTPFEYLRFDAGRYGMTRLQSLAAMKEGPNAAHIARLAREALGRQYRWQQVSPPVDPDTYIDALSVFPEGRNVDAELALAIAEALKTPGNNVLMPDDTQSAGLFIDLNGNGDDEFVILTHRGGMTFARTDDGWSRVKTFQHRYDAALWKQVIRHLAQGEFDAVAPPWKDLQVGSERIRVGPPD